jgi:hypothetical protein
MGFGVRGLRDVVFMAASSPHSVALRAPRDRAGSQAAHYSIRSSRRVAPPPRLAAAGASSTMTISLRSVCVCVCKYPPLRSNPGRSSSLPGFVLPSMAIGRLCPEIHSSRRACRASRIHHDSSPVDRALPLPSTTNYRICAGCTDILPARRQAFLPSWQTSFRLRMEHATARGSPCCAPVSERRCSSFR